MATIGLLTGGGDCAGLDAIIRAAVRRGTTVHGYEFVGIRNGWLGLLEDETTRLTAQNTAGILTRGGTLLCTSRISPHSRGPEGVAAIRATMERHEMEALIVVGGDGTLRGARGLVREGIPLVGVPKTIDNDVAGTERSVGFHTAVQVATDAIDRLRTTAASHNRVMIVEVMGRDVGWIAAYSGLAGGADAILVPEQRFDLDDVCARLRRRHADGRNFSLVVVAEGARPGDQSLNGDHHDETTQLVQSGIGIALQNEIAARTGFDTRATILGHLLRGGTPSASDRILGTRFGIAAVDAINAGRFGTMMALQGGEVVQIDLDEALATRKRLDPRVLDTAEVFFA